MIIEIITLLLAIPTGFLIAWLARDELVQGRKWFRVLMTASVAGIILFWIYDFLYISWTFGFIFLTSLISLMKSKDKKWTKKRV